MVPKTTAALIRAGDDCPAKAAGVNWPHDDGVLAADAFAMRHRRVVACLDGDLQPRAAADGRGITIPR
jgi:hypothetical protein